MTHRAARVEQAVTAVLDKRLRGAGFTARVIPFAGYGASSGASTDGTGWCRVLARVVLVPPGSPRAGHDVRGWRRFALTSAADVPVTIELGSARHVVRSDRDGYLDVRLEAELEPGWQAATLHVDGAEPMLAPVHVVGPDTRLGLVSDLDDTVIVTMLPRPLVAFRNAFLLRESERRPVPGMADLYAEICARNPGTFVVYLSTGAWNAATPMMRFLDRHGYPPGPLLMTDWGPTEDAWFRSGQQHKREQLRRLLGEFEHLSWLLIGDDGQHDPVIYGEIVRDHPGRVHGVAIRQVPLGERVSRADPTSVSLGSPEGVDVRDQVRAPDGDGLRELLARRGLLGTMLGVLAALLVLGGCGGNDDRPTPKPEAASSTPADVPPPEPPSPSPTVASTGPSGETPRQRRENLGGCPEVAGLEPTTPEATVICRYSGGGIEVEVSEPVGLQKSPDLAGYRATVERNNPAPAAPGLGPGAFYSFVEDAPQVCAVWFSAEDGKVLTTSAIKPGTRAGPDGAACTLARQVALDFRG